MADKGDQGGDAALDTKNAEDLALFVQTLLNDMQDKFKKMSDQITTKIDDMGGRITELEKAISTIMAQAGVEEGEAGGKSK